MYRVFFFFFFFFLLILNTKNKTIKSTILTANRYSIQSVFFFFSFEWKRTKVDFTSKIRCAYVHITNQLWIVKRLEEEKKYICMRYVYLYSISLIVIRNFLLVFFPLSHHSFHRHVFWLQTDRKTKKKSETSYSVFCSF